MPNLTSENAEPSPSAPGAQVVTHGVSQVGSVFPSEVVFPAVARAHVPSLALLHPATTIAALMTGIVHFPAHVFVLMVNDCVFEDFHELTGHPPAEVKSAKATSKTTRQTGETSDPKLMAAIDEVKDMMDTKRPMSGFILVGETDGQIKVISKEDKR